MHDKVSDAETRWRATVYLSWKVAVGVVVYALPFGQNKLQQFRAQLIRHEKTREVFRRSLDLTRQRGLLLKVGLDTTPILGRGAEKDTYNLLADGNCQSMRRLDSALGCDMDEPTQQQRYARYL